MTIEFNLDISTMKDGDQNHGDENEIRNNDARKPHSRDQGTNPDESIQAKLNSCSSSNSLLNSPLSKPPQVQFKSLEALKDLGEKNKQQQQEHPDNETESTDSNSSTLSLIPSPTLSLSSQIAPNHTLYQQESPNRRTLSSIFSVVPSFSLPIQISPTTNLSLTIEPNTKTTSTLLLLYTILKYNRYCQDKLTAPPLVFRQGTRQNLDILARMGWTLDLPIRPSFVATSGIVNSVIAYAKGGPSPRPKADPNNASAYRSNLKQSSSNTIPLSSSSSTTASTNTNSSSSTSSCTPDSPSPTPNLPYYPKLDKPIKHRFVPGQDHLHFREIMTMGSDNAKIAIDWELPPNLSLPPNWKPSTNISDPSSTQLHPLQQSILNGPINTPIVLILHGINNDAKFGYMRHLMRTCTDRGWIAAGMNFRGCGGIPLETPRGYNASYTGDIRSVVHQLSQRLEMGVTVVGSKGVEGEKAVPVEEEEQPQPASLFLVGNSLGANLVVKYLGEEGWASQEMEMVEGPNGTKIEQRKYPQALPRCLAGGISLGNPLVIDSEKIAFPWGHILALGLKKTFLGNYHRLRQFKDKHFQSAFFKALWHAPTVGEMDKCTAPYIIRNEPTYPFATKIGYFPPSVGGPNYWKDACSHTHIEHVTLPMLQISAQDDFLVKKNVSKTLNRCLHNPNLIVVKTKSGGHLGWFHVGPKEGADTIFGTSWADQATADFIAAVLEKKRDERLWKGTKKSFKKQVQKNAPENPAHDDVSSQIKQERLVAIDESKEKLKSISSRL